MQSAQSLNPPHQLPDHQITQLPDSTSCCEAIPCEAAGVFPASRSFQFMIALNPSV
jgi:hypothetical protein